MSAGKAKREGRLHISPFAPIPLLCFFFLKPDLTLPAALLAAFLHEGGHLAALYMLGGRAARIEIRPFGGEIRAAGKIFSYPQSILLSGAGILVNLCFAPLFFSRLPQFWRLLGQSSLALALFNLLPVRGLDGGEALEALLCIFILPSSAEKAVRVISALCSVLLLALFLYGCLISLFNPMLVLLGVYLLFCAFSR